VARIEKKIEEDDLAEPYNKLLFTNTLIFCSSFIVSAILNVWLAYHFLGNLDFTAENARELYNQGTAKITGWGFVVILVPMLAILITILIKHSKDLQKLTKLNKEEVLLIGQ